MPFINTRLKSKKTPYRPPECLNSPVAYTQKHPGTNRTRVSLLAAGEGFERRFAPFPACSAKQRTD